jgi:hypothetical protein
MIRGTPVDPYWFVAFAVVFSKGFMSIPAPLAGFHVVIFPFALTILSSTVQTYHHHGQRLRELLWSCNDHLLSIKVTSNLLALYYAAFTFIMAPYFLGRSSMWGQLQSFLLPFSICFSACLVHWFSTQRLNENSHTNLQAPYPLLVVALSASLSLAAITLHPNLLSELQRIFPRPYFYTAENGMPITASSLWEQFSLTKIDSKLFPAIDHLPSKKMTILSDFPNMRQAEVPRSSLRFVFPAPRFDIFAIPAARQMFCERLNPLLKSTSVAVIPEEKRAFLNQSCTGR